MDFFIEPTFFIEVKKRQGRHISQTKELRLLVWGGTKKSPL